MKSQNGPRKKSLSFGNEDNRSIVHRYVQWVLIVGGLALAVSMFTLVGRHTGFVGWGNLSKDLLDCLTGLYNPSILFAGVVALILFYAGQGAVRAGIEIFKDIVTYINDYNFSDDPKTANYHSREHVLGRMQSMMEHLLRNEENLGSKVDEIVFVAHSQGTVITLDAIERNAESWNSDGSLELRLVTMGSPYTHVHNHYFPEAFADIGTRKELQSTGNKGLINDWINIFRIDDFVGTYVDKDGNWPTEYAVGPNGHTNYWVDQSVMKKISVFLNGEKPEDPLKG